MTRPTILPLLCSLPFLAHCATKGNEMRVVQPMKTTYLHAEAVDGGPVHRPPQVLEEVRPAAPADLADPTTPPSVVLNFTIDPEGHIADIEISRATDDRLTAPALEALSRWKVAPALRDGQPIPSVATLQLVFDPPSTD